MHACRVELRGYSVPKGFQPSHTPKNHGSSADNTICVHNTPAPLSTNEASTTARIKQSVSSSSSSSNSHSSISGRAPYALHMMAIDDVLCYGAGVLCPSTYNVSIRSAGNIYRGRGAEERSVGEKHTAGHPMTLAPNDRGAEERSGGEKHTAGHPTTLALLGTQSLGAAPGILH